VSEKKYKQDLLKSNKKVVFCKWSRVSGKTSSAIKLMINGDEGQYSYFTNNISYAMEEIRNIKRDELKGHCNLMDKTNVKIMTPRGTVIENKNGKIDIDFYSNRDITGDGLRGSKNLGVCIFDEYVPSSKEVDLLYQCGAKRIIVLTTIEDFEYISDKNNGEYDIENFINEQIIELAKEYSEIPKYQSTTMTRERVLSQIKDFCELKDKLNK
jgi:hypothetical protein